MNEDVLLAERLSLLVDAPGAGDWSDVIRRVRHARRHRMLTTTAIVAAALVVAVPAAFGLHRVVVDFLSAEPAPERVQLDFARLDLGAPKGMATGVIAGQTRKVPVRSADGTETYVWVAPTRSGGFCYRWDKVGGCRTRSGGIGAGFSSSRAESGAVTIGHIDGATTLDDARRLVLRFADDTSVELPLTWVSAPIDAGFYSYEVPAARLGADRRPEELVLYGDDDRVVARQSFPYPDPLTAENPTTGLPKAVIYEQRRKVLSIETDDGKRITLFSAPSRLSAPSWDRNCMWLSNRDGPVWRAFFGCGNPFPDMPAIGAGIFGGSKRALFAGAVGEGVNRVELVFEDGDTIELPAAEGHVLGELPARHYAPGTRLTLAIARNAAGAEVGRKSFDPTTRSTYPCAPADEVDLGLGVTTCP